jgi:hypothetical protein
MFSQGRFLKKALRQASWLISLLIIIGLAAISVACSPSGCDSDTGQPRAAIIDQLYSTQPNDDFINQVNRDLEAFGFAVHVYQGDDVTVDLYRHLPKFGYKIIVFRVHSGLFEAQGQELPKTAIFTNEPYSPHKYVAEQANHELPIVRVKEGEPLFFGIDSRFVTESMEGRFDDTVIVVAGCSCLYFEDLAQAFISEGASAFLAWDRSVDAAYVDRAAACLVTELCMEGTTIEEAVNTTMIEEGQDPTYFATLRCFPSQNDDQTLKQLIR